MNRFCITFGQKYRYENHEVLGYLPGLPDSWIEVHAKDEKQARAKTVELIGPYWAFIYDEEDFSPGWHPRGCLGELQEVVEQQEKLLDPTEGETDE